MKQMLLKIFAVLWLLVVTPLFGVLPWICLLPLGWVSRYARYLEMAVLWEVAGIFGISPPPDIEDVWPPITLQQLMFVSVIVLVISIVLLVLLFSKKFRNGKLAVSY